jgi:hypothetical protein
MVEVRALPAHHEQRLRARCAAWNAAVFRAGESRIMGIAAYFHSAHMNEACDLSLNLGSGQHGDGLSVVSNCVEVATGFNYGDADAIHFWIKQVSAMPGRSEPSLMNSGGMRTEGDILFDQAEVSATGGGASGQVWLAAVAVGDFALLDHALAVKKCCVGEGAIPLEWAGAGLRTGLVGEGK